MFLFFFQAEDGIRDLVRSRGLGDVYKRQDLYRYENFLYTVELSGQEIKDYLEYSYGNWMNQMLSLIHI